MPHARKFRFGVAANDPATIREVAKKAEDLGYSTLLLPDHMGRQGAPLLTCLAAAGATTRLRVGTQVLASDFRNPAVLAKEVATLDLLTGGRFELGIGVGWPATSATGRSDYAQTGLAVYEPGERVTRLAESLRIIKAFLSSDRPVDFKGKHYQVQGLNPLPRPVQQPRPPIMVAGAGPRMMRLAAREADIINIAPRPPTVGPTPAGSMGFGLTMGDEIALIREAAGERYASLELCVFANNPASGNPAVTDSRDQWIDKLASDLQTTREAVLAMPATLIGSVDSLVERLQRHREQYDISYRVIPLAAMEAFAPVVKRLAGG